MVSSQEYLSMVQDKMREYIDGDKIVINVTSVEDAKLHLRKIRLKQKELLLIKRGIGNTMRTIRSSFTAQRAEIGKPGLKTGLIGGLFGKKQLGKANALQKETLRRQQDAVLSPYEAVIRLIDQSIIILDDLKLQLDTWLVQNK